jgi:hypothetical protein
MSHMDEIEMANLRKECINGNKRACHTLERICEDGQETACQYVPGTDRGS